MFTLITKISRTTIEHIQNQIEYVVDPALVNYYIYELNLAHL